MRRIIPHFVAALQQACDNSARSTKTLPRERPAKFPRKRSILGQFACPWYSRTVFAFIS